jgi:cobalt-zinc-cadmium efflux system protein
MLLFALVGIAVNGYAAWKMSGGKSLNEKVVSWHLLEDVLGWVAILVASIVLLFFDVPFLDPALSIAITLYILWNVIKRLKETLFLFLQGVPNDIHVPEIEEKLLDIQYVDSAHHTHIWSLDGEHHVFTTHLKLKPLNGLEKILSIKKEVKNILKNYPFEHYTVETELSDEDCGLLQQSYNH